MLTSLRRMIGMPVIWQDRQLGYVEEALPSEDARALAGVILRRGIGSAKWCPADAILSVGAECVLVKCEPLAASRVKPAGMEKAYLTTGQCVGEVTDAILRNGQLGFAALEVSPGPLYRLMGRCAYACDYRTDPRSGSVIVPQLLTWAQLRRQLGEEDNG